MFPPEDLLEDLINLYFLYLPSYMTLLHEPTFRRDVASGLHHLDTSFGAVVLMVCAVASRGSSDPRVFLEAEPDAVQSAGWKWYSQTMTPPRSFFENPSIYDVQFCVLAAQYLLGTSAPQSAWTMIGLAARYAIELGLHRHRPGPPTLESELKKRVFWSIFMMDRHCSLYQGRPFMIRDEDFDVKYPFECDDEYWDTGNPATDFKQPPGEPSKMHAFVQYLNLCHIISFMMRTLYGIRKSQEAAGLKGSWIENTVAVLDSMLNSWYNDLPTRLRWDPQAQPGKWFLHSAKLYMIYYDLQIHVHRPFVHSPSPLALPSLAICTNAARSCIRLVEILLATSPVLSLIPNVGMAIFSAGTIIITNMWHTVRTRPGEPPLQRDGQDLCRCMNVLQQGAKQ
ncbi:hypothetical protein BDZ89DRAFT_945120 [Hymenopellis radicata]|nr:hypothetical protein BDZ89DRAFT_945120 [Hymenopellis radicata]